MAIRFYSWPMSSGARTHWALEELGVPYEHVQLDRTKQEHKAPEFLAINPNGKVPALVDDGVAYFESLAIALYLGERYGVERGLWPTAAKDRAEALSWSVWGLVELQYNMREYIYHGLASPISYKAEDQSKAAGEFNHGAFKRHLAMLDRRLSDREHVCGAFTLVDTVVGSTVRFGTMMGVKLDGAPHVAAYLERLAKRPAWSRIG
jgi:glutathione S-transferase